MAALKSGLVAENSSWLPFGARRHSLGAGAGTQGSASGFKALYTVSDPRSPEAAGHRGKEQGCGALPTLELHPRAQIPSSLCAHRGCTKRQAGL